MEHRAYFGQEANVADPYKPSANKGKTMVNFLRPPGKTSEQTGPEEQKNIVSNYDRACHVVWSRSLEPRAQKIQVVQNKAIRITVDAPWYVRNTTIRRDLEIRTIKEVP